MKIKVFINNEFGENCYVAFDESSKEAIIIDPGMVTEKEQQKVGSFVKDNELTIKHILLTHSHVDHVYGCSYCVKEFGLGITGSLEDQLSLPSAHLQAQLFGVTDCGTVPSITTNIGEGDTLQFGNLDIKVIDCPGHSHHGLCFYIPQAKVVFTGDVLFNMSVGRSDFGPKFGGDGAKLIENIKNKLLTLPSDVDVYPGHGPRTAIELEIKRNPYLI